MTPELAAVAIVGVVGIVVLGLALLLGSKRGKISVGKEGVVLESDRQEGNAE
jgi:hypothetical protein